MIQTLISRWAYTGGESEAGGSELANMSEVPRDLNPEPNNSRTLLCSRQSGVTLKSRLKLQWNADNNIQLDTNGLILK